MNHFKMNYFFHSYKVDSSTDSEAANKNIIRNEGMKLHPKIRVIMNDSLLVRRYILSF